MDRCAAGRPGGRTNCAEKLGLYRKTKAPELSPTACPEGRGHQPELSPMLSGFVAHCDPIFWRSLACEKYRVHRSYACQDEPRLSYRPFWSVFLQAFRLRPWPAVNRQMSQMSKNAFPVQRPKRRQAATGVITSTTPTNAIAGIFAVTVVGLRKPCRRAVRQPRLQPRSHRSPMPAPSSAHRPSKTIPSSAHPPTPPATKPIPQTPRSGMQPRL